MFIDKNKKGIGWHTTVKDTDDRNVKTDNPLYVNYIFSRDAEPQGDKLEGTLMFVAKDGTKYHAFPYVNEYNGQRSLQFRLYIPKKKDDTGKFGNPNVSIESSELPFY